MNVRLVTVAVAVASSTAFGYALAATAAAPSSGGSTLSNFAGFDSIKTAQFHYNINNGDFQFPTHFYATRQGTDISADRATGNSQRKTMHATGDVVVHQDKPVAGSTRAVDLTQRPSTLTCDSLDVDGNRKIFTAVGNMHFTQEGGHDASSDRAVLDDSNHHLHMEGHVRVRDGERTVESDVLDYDTATGQLDGNGNVTITSPVETPTPGARPAPTKKPKKKRIF